MSFLKIEVDHRSNGNEFEPTRLMGINIENINSIIKYGDSPTEINITVGGSRRTKSFKTSKECNDYFEYLASKLEAVDLSPQDINRK